MMHMSSITVYSAPGCTQCNATKKHLRRRGLEYNEIDISENPESKKYVEDKGFVQVPVVDMGNGDMFYGFRPDRIDSYAKELSVA
mgnify:FL=1